jgi:hypothetical protein
MSGTPHSITSWPVLRCLIMDNLEIIRRWVIKYEHDLERGLFDHLTKFRKLEWEATYMLAITHLERNKNYGS